MDGSQFSFAPGPFPGPDRLGPPPEPRPDPLPDREWGLSAGQVVAVVLTILAVCELIGLVT